ncbi:type II toxin-antitoxin system Phd/YefM family antitoxin [Nocardioides sp. NPDC101246]|uniref:type II toxin-antitoxin system Phd/YefM family antitoxin n=1 Tax=Nocardioides sp. NPDC101246 TaxID=3364336 RepID=UPI0037F64AB9
MDAARLVKVQEAKTHLSSLLAKVEAGEEIVIARGDHAIARLVPINRPTRRILGGLRVSVPDEFFDPLPDDEIAAWEGSLDEDL